MTSQNENEDEEGFSWREWFIDGARQLIYVGLGLGVILGVLGLEHFSGIAVKFDFSKNSPEVGYIMAGIMGGVVVTMLNGRRRLRLEQELSATLADALTDNPDS